MVAIAKTIANKCASINAINAEYSALKNEYDLNDLRTIIDLAKDLKRKQYEEADSHRDALIGSINGERVLRAVFADLQKDKEWKWLANKAICKAGSVSELIRKWYPDTINGEPARKLWVDDAHTMRIWTVKEITRSNAASILVACIKNITKAYKHQKQGTTVHTEGEECPVKVK